MPRVLEYLSPSSIADWFRDLENFYIERLAAARPDRFPQADYMSIGSAFDAYVKSHLHQILFGHNHDDSAKFSFETLFESQVEPQNRDWAREHGEKAFEFYRNSGALADLLLDLHRAKGEVSFEGEIRGQVGGVTLLGKPDCWYINAAGHPVILDWKVNGWCGKGNTSPKPGYLRCRTCHPGGNASVRHKDAIPIEKHGVQINGATTMEKIEKMWASQLSIYGWLYGAEVGGEFICAVDQIAANNTKGGDYPECRIAEHRLLVSAAFQKQLLADAQMIWGCLQSGHIFKDLSREDSDAKCAQLEARAQLYRDKPEFAAAVRTRAHY